MDENPRPSQASTKVCLNCHKEVDGTETNCPHDGGDLVSSRHDPLVGTTFAGRYSILKIAGHGGMSTVYKSQHVYMERIVAVKLLHKHLISDPVSIQRFQQEAKASSSLTHPNIITVYDFGITEDEGLAYLVMDYLEGPSLGDLIDEGGPLHEKEALDLFRQITRGLVHAHGKGVVHRDLKPRNLVLTVQEDGDVLVKIVDFGIAKMLPREGVESQHLTQTGEVFGSPIYMSPEQCSGQPLDARSDVYSMGCVMYEVLTGIPPFIGQNAVETMSMHVSETPPPFSEVAPNLKISARTEELVMACLAKKPKKRIQSAADLLDELPRAESIATPEFQSDTMAVRVSNLSTGKSRASSPSRIVPRKSRSRLRITARGLATVLLAILIPTFFITVVYQGPDEDPGSPLCKLYWQSLLTIGDGLTKLGAYGLAVPVLEQAHSVSENLDYLQHRKNYDKTTLTVMKLALAYSALGRSRDQERMVDEFLDLDSKRSFDKADALLEELDDAEKYIRELKEAGEPIQPHLSEEALNWAGLVRPIIEVARRNEVNHNYQIELDLLSRAEQVMRVLYGPDFVGLADLMLQRAQCLRVEDRIEEIDDEKLYENAAGIEERYAKSLYDLKPDQKLTLTQIADSPRYVRKLVKLGQWQRDRSRFEQAGPNLSLAIKAAELCEEIGPSETAEIYCSYADFLEQTGKTQASESYKLKAREARSEAQKLYKKERIKELQDENKD